MRYNKRQIKKKKKEGDRGGGARSWRMYVLGEQEDDGEQDHEHDS